MNKWGKPDFLSTSLAFTIALYLFFALIGLVFLGYQLGRLIIHAPPPPHKPKEAPVVIRLDLTPEAMRACAEAFVRYGFWDIRDYECRVERGPKGMVVALYGPGADGKAGEKKRLGEVPFSGGE
jgi:hypothetical protein